MLCCLSCNIRIHAQSLSKLEYEVSEFCKRMQTLKGVLYIDTADIICDASPLNAKFSQDLAEEMESIIKKMDMECRELSFKNIYKDFERVYFSPDSFFYDTIPLPDYTEYEINYSIKADSVFRSLWDRSLLEKDSVFSSSELNRIESLLMSSSNYSIVMEKNGRTAKRLPVLKD